MVTVSSFVPGLLSKLPTFTFHAWQCHSSVHGLLSHTTTYNLYFCLQILKRSRHHVFKESLDYQNRTDGGVECHGIDACGDAWREMPTLVASVVACLSPCMAVGCGVTNPSNTSNAIRHGYTLHHPVTFFCDKHKKKSMYGD
jgi:hypothetical protein